MIDAVSAVSVQNFSPRSQAAAAASYAVSSAVSASNFVSSRIRVDNLLDLAILEFRSGDTGDVIRQYPTESQIRAFQRADEADARHAAEKASRNVQLEAPVHLDAAPKSSAPVPTPLLASSPAPAPSDATPSDGGGSSAPAPQQSVLA